MLLIFSALPQAQRSTATDMNIKCMCFHYPNNLRSINFPGRQLDTCKALKNSIWEHRIQVQVSRLEAHLCCL